MIDKNRIATDKRNEVPFEDLWNLESTIFKFIGKSLHSAFSGDQYKYDLKENVVFYFGFSMLSSFICFSIYTLCTVKCDITFAAEFVPILLSMFIVTVKGYILWTRRFDLSGILQSLYTLWGNSQFNVNLMRKIYPLLKVSKKMRYSYVLTGLFLGFSYGLRPFTIMLITSLGTTPDSNSTVDYSITVYPLKYPFDHQTFNRYILLLLYEICVGYFAVTYLICDALYIQLMAHLAIDFMIIGDEFREMYQPFNDEAANIQETIKLVCKHRDLLSLVQSVESVYSPVFFVTIILEGMDLCLCVLILDKELTEGDWVLLAKSSMHACLLIVQIYIYCNFSHIVTELINQISISLYDSGWVDSSIRFKKILMVIMMRTNKKYSFTAYNIVVLNREQMTRIFQTTMSYFTMLRNFA